MTTTKRANGKIIFDAPGLTKAQVEKLADSVIEGVAPKIAKLAKPPKKKTYPKKTKVFQVLPFSVLYIQPAKTIMSFTSWYAANREALAETKKHYYKKWEKKVKEAAKNDPLFRKATTKEFSQVVYKELKTAEPKKLYWENNS